MENENIKNWTNQYSDQMKVRINKKDEMIDSKINPYKNNHSPNTSTAKLIKEYGQLSKEEIGETPDWKLAGRAIVVREFGKTSFIQLDDGLGRIQIYVKKSEMNEDDIKEFEYLDYGDIIYVEGKMFKTQKGELSLRCKVFRILTKSIRPLPEKFHGLTDPELCYRMRYVDLIVNPQSREMVRTRSLITRYIRDFFHQKDYIEVETPMLHLSAGGAAAKPFETHHNALDMPLSLRIAPELHLKRLIVGGFPRVFEINRCFRNEGISVKHHPEFTTIEFYQAYATYKDLIKLTEELFHGLATSLFNTEDITYKENNISFKRPFQKMTMKEAICKYSSLTMDDLNDPKKIIDVIITKNSEREKEDLQSTSLGKLIEIAFEEFAEENLINPTFITEYPVEISPLSRRNDENPNFVDRFEFFINGWEMGNAFSELNNPTDQLERFAEQAEQKNAGNQEACDVDYDFVRALEYGMPPTAGEGIGIDRLCMIFTEAKSIRDIITFPLLKRENFF